MGCALQVWGKANVWAWVSGATTPAALVGAHLLRRAEGAIPVPLFSGREPEVVKNSHDPVATRTEWHPFVPYLPKFEPGRFITDKGEGTIAGALIHMGPPRCFNSEPANAMHATAGRFLRSSLWADRRLLYVRSITLD